MHSNTRILYRMPFPYDDRMEFVLAHRPGDRFGEWMTGLWVENHNRFDHYVSVYSKYESALASYQDAKETYKRIEERVG